jgi:D-beta-D-heptose 7-phosphate kinase / D-beta-D-heptose 1-phosphate adenosyltransferase
MLDHFVYSRSQERDNPERPGAPLTSVYREEFHPGGAGNVAGNLASLGGVVQFLYVGAPEDPWQNVLDKQLTQEHANLVPVQVDDIHRTQVIRKQRIYTDEEYTRRDDFGETNLQGETDLQPLSITAQHWILDYLERDVHLDGTGAIFLSDYAKGMFTDKGFVQELIRIAKMADIPVLVDPKPANASNYIGATLVRPNVDEARAITGYSGDDYEELTARLQETLDTQYAAVTLGGGGVVTLDGKFTRYQATTRPEEVRDVAGAGDTFMSTLCLGLVSDLNLEEAAYLANLASGMAVRELGITQVSGEDLSREVLKYE